MIVSQPLQTALKEFSRHFKQTLLYEPGIAQGIQAPAVFFEQPPETVLTAMLNQSGLCHRQIDTGWLIIRCPEQTDKNKPHAVKKAKKIVNEPVEIEVTGYRESLRQAREMKRLSLLTQDTIMAEDIADFPDLNLADSLQRIPGVTITREGGEGRQISLRGLGPDFTRVQINDLETMAMTSSAMDARGAVSRTRAFDFTVFASELFSQIDVTKAYSVEMDEGGIGGTVILYTPKPFDLSRKVNTFSAKQTYNSNSKKADPRFVATISRHGDQHGGLMSLVYSRRNTMEYGTNTTRWRKEKKHYTGNDDQFPAQALENGEFWFPRGHRYSVWNNEQTRLGLVSVWQYRPSAQFSLLVEGLGSRLNNRLDEHHIAVKDNQNVDYMQWEQNGEDKEVLYVGYSDASWRIETREDENTTEFYQLSINSQWQPTPRWTFELRAGISANDYEQPKVQKVNIRQSGIDIITDFREDRFYGTSLSPKVSPEQLDDLVIKDLYFQQNYMRSELESAKISAEYAFEPMQSLVFGLNNKTFDNSGYDSWKSMTPGNGELSFSSADIDQMQLSLFTQHPDMNWTQGNLQKIQRDLGIDNMFLTDQDIINGSNFALRENTLATFALYDGNVDVGLDKLYLRAGARYYRTKVSLSGFAGEEHSVVHRSYSDWLYSTNLVREFGEDLLLRFGADQNITRPSIEELSFSARVSQTSRNEGDIGIVNMGNPYLEPLKSTNINSALEWYFESGGMVSASVFYKKFSNFLSDTVERKPYSSLGLPANLLQNGESLEDDFYVIVPTNRDTAVFKGFEVAFNLDHGFLPSPFHQVGIAGNYTFAQGESVYRNVANPEQSQQKPFPGLSEHSYNITVYYENEWGAARISGAYRSPYLLDIDVGNIDQDESGYHSTLFVDASVNIHLNAETELSVEALNITDTREELYSDSGNRAYNTTSSGRTFLVGVTWRF